MTKRKAQNNQIRKSQQNAKRRRSAQNSNNKTPNRNAQPRLDNADRCAIEYAKVLVNPFDAPPTCLPWPPALRSRKVKSWSKGTFYAQDGLTSGTPGFGYIAVKPTMAGDNGFVIHTTKDSITSSIQSSTGLGVTVVSNNSVYANADFTSDGVNGRIVSVGLKIRWAGTNLSMNGSAVSLEHPTHQSLLTNTFTSLRAWDRARVVPVTRDWTTVTWQPVRPGDYSFSEGTAQPAGSDHYNMAIVLSMASGAASELGPFEYEAVINYEVVGNNVQGTTISHTAIDSSSKIISAVGQAPTEYFDLAANSTAMQGLSLGVGTLLQKAIPALGGLAFQRYAERSAIQYR